MQQGNRFVNYTWKSILVLGVYIRRTQTLKSFCGWEYWVRWNYITKPKFKIDQEGKRFLKQNFKFFFEGACNHDETRFLQSRSWWSLQDGKRFVKRTCKLGLFEKGCVSTLKQLFEPNLVMINVRVKSICEWNQANLAKRNSEKSSTWTARGKNLHHLQ